MSTLRRTLRLLLVENPDLAGPQLIDELGEPLLGELVRVDSAEAACIALRNGAFSVVVVALATPGLAARPSLDTIRTIAAEEGCPPIIADASHAPALALEAVLVGADDAFATKDPDLRRERGLQAMQFAMIRATRSAARHRGTARLEQHNQRLQRFARVMAHDMKAPVAVAFTSVETAATMIRRGEADQAGVYLEVAQRRLRQIIDHFDEILDEAISQTSGTVDVDVAATAELAFTNLPHEARERTSLVVEPGPKVNALPGALRQVMQNLLANAAAHNDGHVTVLVRAVGDDDRVRILIDDDGAGWRRSPEQLLRDGASTGNSTGIGLTTIQHAVESMDGTLDFGTSPSGGARVIIEFATRTHDRGGTTHLDQHLVGNRRDAGEGDTEAGVTA